ncbi:hypothetical protein AAVH_19766, partial [Aphelenchoides avenae]
PPTPVMVCVELRFTDGGKTRGKWFRHLPAAGITVDQLIDCAIDLGVYDRSGWEVLSCRCFDGSLGMWVDISPREPA